MELFGKIEEIKDNSLILNEYGSPADTLTLVDLKEIFIDDTTKIIKRAKKTREQFQKEQDEFNRKIKQLKSEGKDIFNANISVPSWFIEQEIGLSDLTVGQDVTIQAIKEAESDRIVAQEIELVVGG